MQIEIIHADREMGYKVQNIFFDIKHMSHVYVTTVVNDLLSALGAYLIFIIFLHPL